MSSRSTLYIKTTLEPTFKFTKLHFYKYIMQINLAHVLMLKDQAILPQEQASKILEATDTLYKEGYAKNYNTNFEDLFFMIEDDLTGLIGADLVGNMHIAFSRNDMDTTMFRMFWREKILEWLDKINALRSTILTLVQEHSDTIMTAHTHNQQAQPTTLGHYLLAVENNLLRDIERGIELFKRINRSPMGAAALSTSGFPIDRHNISDRLGFQSPMNNSYDAISSSDFMMEINSVLSISLSTLSRFVYDLIFMTTNEVNTLRLHDMHVQTSSIMPQKRNPSALEHTRASISKAIGDLKGTVMLAHNVPFGDIVDIGDDIQPPLFSGFQHTQDVLTILNEILTYASFDKIRLYSQAQAGFATVTELADVLVRHHHVPFRQAHGIVSSFVKELMAEGAGISAGSAERINRIAKNHYHLLLSMTKEDFTKAICPKNFIQVRSVYGGPAPEETLLQAEVSIQHCEKTSGWVASALKKLERYEEELDDNVASCITNIKEN
ncbi:argininosuccinate lyase [Bacillus sp. LL01]|uniref:argininosuccinate lyase n=1 Tax=Bacillus sp. LL01 TaxID=1665556 RepID=UPI00069F6243|nr:argininosuccinate lyase [Bacillus sp. LL01]